jgi:hypothetical protein
MGKKKIAKKFASVKRIISTQDERMYQLTNQENQTNRNFKLNKKKECSFYRGKLPIK